MVHPVWKRAQAGAAKGGSRVEKYEVPFVRVDGRYYGGNQEWSPNWLTRLGGCSTVTACEISICMARHGVGEALYPYDPYHVTMSQFLDFLQNVFTFVRPGVCGLTSLEQYAQEFDAYATTRNVRLAAECLHGEEPVADAQHFVQSGLQHGIPLACLVLNHKDRSFKDVEWHWFCVTGWEREADQFRLIVGTYGNRYVLDLNRLWDTGHRQKGGLVRMYVR